MKKLFDEATMRFLQQVVAATIIELDAVSRLQKFDRKVKGLISRTKNRLERLLTICQNFNDERKS